MEMEYSKGICLHLMDHGRNLLNSHTRILSCWNNVVYRLVVSASGGWVVYKLGEYTTRKRERERFLGKQQPTRMSGVDGTGRTAVVRTGEAAAFVVGARMSAGVRDGLCCAG